MKVGQFARLFVLAVAMSVWQAGAAEIVYDNSTDYLEADYESVDEYGDEVILAGTARIVTEIQLEYYADFVPNGNQLGRLRFYANTGPAWHDNLDYKMPASPPFYEDTFQVITGFQAVAITIPNVVVPDHFTWTVQFLGISQTKTNDRAGLLFYDPPTIGQSFDDFWELLPNEGWSPLARPDVKNNFGARIVAVAAAAPRLTIAKSGNNVVISWPSNVTGTLESNTDLNTTTWTPVAQTPVVNGANFQVTLPIGAGNRFIRLKTP